MRGRKLVTVVSCFLIGFSAQIGLANEAQVFGRWTGAERLQGQLLHVQFDFERAAEAAPQSSGFRNTSLVQPDSSIPISGTLSRQVVPDPSNRRSAAGEKQTHEISGIYYPLLNLLQIQISGVWSRSVNTFLLFEPQTVEMVVLYTGTTNNLPIVLSKGEEFPQSVQPFLPVSVDGLNERLNERNSLVAQTEAHQQRMREIQLEITQAVQQGDRDAMQRLQKEAGEISNAMVKAQQDFALQQRENLKAQAVQGGSVQDQYLALQIEMQEAAAAGDREKLQALQLKQQEMILALRKAPALQQQSESCPADIVSWVKEMDANGASFQSFAGLAQLSNLFRPSVFHKHFGSSFGGLPTERRSEIEVSLQRTCIRPGTEFYTSRSATSIHNAFGNNPNYGMQNAGIAGVALDVTASWAQNTTKRVESEGSVADANFLSAHLPSILSVLWPNELEQSKTKLASVASGLSLDELLGKLTDSSGRVSSNQGTAALREISRLHHQGLYRQLSTEEKAQFDKQVINEVNRVLPAYLSSQDQAQVRSSGSDVKQSLAENARWFRSHSDIFAALRESRVAQEYLRELGQQRENAYKQIESQLNSDIAALASRDAVNRFGNDFVLGMDNSHSPTWRKIATSLDQRGIAVEREAFVARVGEGPFDADHPGAIYLNAIYRGDYQTIRAEDTRFSEPLRQAMQPINDSGVYEIFALFSGGSYTADDIKGYMDSEIRNHSMTETLAGFFIVSYEHIYPSCMTNSVVMERTVYWDNVTTDGWGNELWRTSDSQTYTYNLNARHVDIFKQVGDGQSPEETELVGSLFGDFMPASLRSSQAMLSSTLRGLRQAMQTMACDDKDMQQFERNLMQAAVR